MKCSTCGALMRPYLASEEDYPGTVQHTLNGLCIDCHLDGTAPPLEESIEDEEWSAPRTRERFIPPGLQHEDPKVRTDAANVLAYMDQRRRGVRAA